MMHHNCYIFIDDHAKGLSTFTIMAGLGGFMGYGLGGINWDATAIGVMLGGHLHATFTLITIIFLICVSCTITSFKEIPLELLEKDQEYQYLQEQKVCLILIINISSSNIDLIEFKFI